MGCRWHLQKLDRSPTIQVGKLPDTVEDSGKERVSPVWLSAWKVGQSNCTTAVTKGGLCCCRDFIATMTDGIVFVSLCSVCHTDNVRLRVLFDCRETPGWGLGGWALAWSSLRSPSFYDDPPAAEPPTSPGPPPMPDDAAPDAQRSRRQRGCRSSRVTFMDFLIHLYYILFRGCILWAITSYYH